MVLGLRYAARSDVGVIRPGNEDSGYAGSWLLAVADGMGGHAAGELASAIAVATFAEVADAQLSESEALSGEIGSARIHELFMQHFAETSHPVELVGYRLDRQGGIDVIEAQVRQGGRLAAIQGRGEGALEAFVQAWTATFGNRINVIDYSEHALGEGTAAEAVAYVQVNVDGQRSAGAAFDRDTVSASMRAVLAAINRVQLARAAA